MPPGHVRILRVSGRTAEALADDGRPTTINLPRTIAGGPAAPGDIVEISGEPPRGRAVRPRSSVLARGTARGGTRVLAANAEVLVVVVAAVDPPPSLPFIDRYLAAGELGGLRPFVAVTKTDLPHDEAVVAELSDLYTAVGYTVEQGSATEGDLVVRIADRIGGIISVLAGHSGVGKSTLTAALTGEARATGAVSVKARTGRHTTTDPRLIPLPGGGGVIDTAGVRTFHLAPTEGRVLADGFPDIAAASGGCRFRTCLHAGDDGCVVDEVVAPSRLATYRALLADTR